MAENHPVGFQWVMEAREKHGTQVIHVDPRFSRTSAMANIWLPLRAGSDILMLGALVNYAIENELFFREYLVHYTNAAVIISEKYQDTEDLDGLFSGWDPDKKKYDPASWMYAGAEPERWGTAAASHGGHGGAAPPAPPELPVKSFCCPPPPPPPMKI